MDKGRPAGLHTSQSKEMAHGRLEVLPAAVPSSPSKSGTAFQALTKANSSRKPSWIQRLQLHFCPKLSLTPFLPSASTLS